MLELPSSNEELAWIVGHEPDRLLLIPGLDADTLRAAAGGDQHALACLRATAQSSTTNTHNMSDVDFWYMTITCKRDRKVSASHPLITAAGCQAVTSGDLVDFTMHRMRVAAQEGRLAALQWLRAICQPVRPEEAELVAAAAAAGQLHILQYLCSKPNCAPCDFEPLCNAWEHPACLAYLRTLTPTIQCPRWASEDLAYHGSLDMLQQLHAHGALEDDPLHTTAALDQAVIQGHLPLLMWLRSLDPPCPWSAGVIAWAARHEDLAMMQWMRRQQPPCPWDSSCPARAAASGNFRALQWMRKQVDPCPWDAGVCRALARRANLTALQWVRQQNPPCPWDSTCAAGAAIAQSLEVLQWLRCQEPPCPWDADVAHEAALRGNVPMLRWIRSEYGILEPRLYHTAISYEHAHVLQWLHQERIRRPDPPWPSSSMSVPVLMFLGGIRYRLSPTMRDGLKQARRTFCMFHGLVRWCSRPGSDPRQYCVQHHGRAPSRASGVDLLLGLARLPAELVTKIAVAAGLQHDLL